MLIIHRELRQSAVGRGLIPGDALHKARNYSLRLSSELVVFTFPPYFGIDRENEGQVHAPLSILHLLPLDGSGWFGRDVETEPRYPR